MASPTLVVPKISQLRGSARSPTCPELLPLMRRFHWNLVRLVKALLSNCGSYWLVFFLFSWVFLLSFCSRSQKSAVPPSCENVFEPLYHMLYFCLKFFWRKLSGQFKGQGSYVCVCVCVCRKRTAVECSCSWSPTGKSLWCSSVASEAPSPSGCPCMSPSVSVSWVPLHHHMVITTVGLLPNFQMDPLLMWPKNRMANNCQSTSPILFKNDWTFAWLLQFNWLAHFWSFG